MEPRQEHQQDLDRKEDQQDRFQFMQLEERIAPTQSHYPPGQFPSGTPGHHEGAGNAPGNSWHGN